MIPETSRELHLNLCDQSRLGSSLSHTCLTALNTPCVHKACVCGDRRYTSGHHRLTLSPPEWPRSTAAHNYRILTSSARPHWLAHTFIHQTAPEKLSHQRLYFKLFTYHSCISVSARSTCRWWNLSSLKSWWAFPPSHGCNSHTWLPEDFPGYNFNRFHLSVILRCNKMWQTYVLLALFLEPPVAL